MSSMIPARPPVAGALTGTPMVKVPVVTIEIMSALITQLQTQVLDLLTEVDDLNLRVAALDGHPPHPPHPHPHP